MFIVLFRCGAAARHSTAVPANIKMARFSGCMGIKFMMKMGRMKFNYGVFKNNSNENLKAINGGNNFRINAEMARGKKCALKFTGRQVEEKALHLPF